ncbi:hypothetical protein [Okeania sp. SIO3I5]|nr:hypothetical protein [Okeania sp. SIO3I5]
MWEGWDVWGVWEGWDVWGVWEGCICKVIPCLSNGGKVSKL